MRCIDRGEVPLDASGSPVFFNDYREAVSYLKDRVGRYCSFCERWIASGLAVEHKIPKSFDSSREREWSNFLLACVNCNSIKGKQIYETESVLWPDLHNTQYALEYLISGRIVARDDLDDRLKTRARRLLSMMGLDRVPPTSKADHRWMDRLQAWALASQSVADFEEKPDLATIKRIVDTAATHGSFSVWVTAFRNYPNVAQALAVRFPGTVLREAPTGSVA